MNQTMRGLKELAIPGDGNCLFAAVAAGLLLDPRQHPMTPTPRSKHDIEASIAHGAAALRARVVDALQERMKTNRNLGLLLQYNPRTLQPFPDAMSPGARQRAYLDAMARDGTYGGEIELSVMPAVTGRTIIVHRASTPPQTYAFPGATQEVHLLYKKLASARQGVESGHYTTLLPTGPSPPGTSQKTATPRPAPPRPRTPPPELLNKWRKDMLVA
jgi:hypothetical protein